MKYRFLVTCATGDIGTELCFHLAKKGHDLIITSRDLAKLKALSEKIISQHPERRIDSFSADLGKPETMKEIIEKTNAIGIDGIVLMPPRPPILPSDPIEQFHTLNKAMQDCLSGPRFLLQQLLPAMDSSDLKSVVFISGTSSKQPIVNPDWEAFNNVRTAWVGCIKTFSDIYGEKGI